MTVDNEGIALTVSSLRFTKRNSVLCSFYQNILKQPSLQNVPAGLGAVFLFLIFQTTFPPFCEGIMGSRTWGFRLMYFMWTLLKLFLFLFFPQPNSSIWTFLSPSLSPHWCLFHFSGYNSQEAAYRKQGCLLQQISDNTCMETLWEIQKTTQKCI